MRLLDIAGIDYDPRSYDPEIVDGLSVAKALNEDPEAVFKTLVTENEKKEYFVFCVPVGAELDLKKAAKAVGAKSIEMIPLKELLPLTGYLHGGCSPMGLKKPFPVALDETMQLFERIYISAGKRGYQVGLNPTALAAYCHASFVDLSK